MTPKGKAVSEHVTVETNKPHDPEFTATELKKIKAAAQINIQAQRDINTRRFVWHTTATEIIKEKLEVRKKKGFKNDWKIKFYQDKLAWKPKLLAKLSKLI